MKLILVCAICLVLNACEIINLGGKSYKVTQADQFSSKGVVLIFKTEIDSNNISAACKFFAKEDAKPMLAVEKYEIQSEIARIGNQLRNKPITALTSDTISPVKQRVRAEFNYTKTLTFTTVKIDNFWFIATIQE